MFLKRRDKLSELSKEDLDKYVKIVKETEGWSFSLNEKVKPRFLVRNILRICGLELSNDDAVSFRDLVLEKSYGLSRRDFLKKGAVAAGVAAMTVNPLFSKIAKAASKHTDDYFVQYSQNANMTWAANNLTKLKEWGFTNTVTDFVFVERQGKTERQIKVMLGPYSSEEDCEKDFDKLIIVLSEREKGTDWSDGLMIKKYDGKKYLTKIYVEIETKEKEPVKEDAVTKQKVVPTKKVTPKHEVQEIIGGEVDSFNKQRRYAFRFWPEWVTALVQTESNFNPNTVGYKLVRTRKGLFYKKNSKGQRIPLAKGLMQITLSSCKEYFKNTQRAKNFFYSHEAYNPRSNIKIGINQFAKSLNAFFYNPKNPVSLKKKDYGSFLNVFKYAIAAYNRGSQGIRNNMTEYNQIIEKREFPYEKVSKFINLESKRTVNRMLDYLEGMGAYNPKAKTLVDTKTEKMIYPYYPKSLDA
ncbi:lytic transglycosylase domain-containing protein [Candidatus Woesearchaeota archaeon]|nr:lytic transglycosylase domain-containing protein [Candidatus Woesearchaeota archaeon]